MALRALVERSIRALPQFEQGLRTPKRWAAIRRRLEAMDVDHISIKDFRQICEEEGITERVRQDDLLDFLHHLGAVLHFREVAGLRHLVILRPEWATNAVYRLLDHTKKKGADGHFVRADLDKVWQCAEYEDYFEELLLMMQRFELCYEAPEKKGLYIVPSLLPDEAPEHYVWPDDSADMQLWYEYSFMPKGIVTRLIVRQHSLLASPPTVWKRGAIFAIKDARAEVLESYRDKRIGIKASGKSAKKLLTDLARDIDALNSGFHFNERMTLKQIVPCNCPRCKNAARPYPFEYQRLLNRLENGRETVECEVSFQEVVIPVLLRETFADAEEILRQIEGRKSFGLRERHGRLEEMFASGHGLAAGRPLNISIRTIKIFLASSEELRDDRDKFELYFRQLNDDLPTEKGIYLKIVRWENFLDAMSETRLQEEYNKEVRACDIFVSLFFTKTGKFTEEEFDVAHRQFKETGKPQIFTFFKDEAVKPSQLKEFQTVENFKKKLSNLGHFYTNYDSIEHLKRQFRDQLDKLLRSQKL